MICNLAPVGILRCTYLQRTSVFAMRTPSTYDDGHGDGGTHAHLSHVTCAYPRCKTLEVTCTRDKSSGPCLVSHVTQRSPHDRARKGGATSTTLKERVSQRYAAVMRSHMATHTPHTHTHDTKLRESGNTKQGPCSSKRLARPPARLFANHFRTASPPPQFHRPRPACIHPPPSAPLDMPACRPPRRASRFGRALRPPIFQPHALAPHSSPHHRACYGLRQASHDASHSIIRQLATGRPTLLDHSSTRHAALCRCAGHTGHTAQQPAKIWAKLRSSIASSVVLKTLIGVVCGLPRAARYLVAVSIAARRSRSEAP